MCFSFTGARLIISSIHATTFFSFSCGCPFYSAGASQTLRFLWFILLCPQCIKYGLPWFLLSPSLTPWLFPFSPLGYSVQPFHSWDLKSFHLSGAVEMADAMCFAKMEIFFTTSGLCLPDIPRGYNSRRSNHTSDPFLSQLLFIPCAYIAPNQIAEVAINIHAYTPTRPLLSAGLWRRCRCLFNT